MTTKQRISGLGLALLTPFVYVLTIHPATKEFSFWIVIFFFILALSAYLFKRNNLTLLIYSVTLFILFLVGMTGWYFSPFFNWLYLLAIAIAFLFDPHVSAFFIIVLVALFLPNIGSIDIVLDLLFLTSLLFIIPLTYFLRGEYLKLKENEKKILILEKEREHYKSTLEEVLANKVIKFAVDLREPVNDVKQLGYFLKENKDNRTEKNIDKIIKLAENAIDLIRNFEEPVTGKKLVKSPRRQSSS